MKETEKSALKKVEGNMKQIKKGYRKWFMIDTGDLSEAEKNKKREYATNRYNMSEEHQQKLRKHNKN